MSRIGKKPIPLPKGVEINVGDQIEVKGPKGRLTVALPAGIQIQNENGTLTILRNSDKDAAKHGLVRALTANAVTGVSTGFTRELDVVGTGYRMEIKGRIVSFSLGYSHAIEFMLPEGVEAKVDKLTHLVLTSHDKQLLGQVCANMRFLRPPDPYKNKGVRYTGEVLRKKAGKAGAGGK
ncbi:MAG: 50S ribosomal protein L6 [Bryobacterales bacterium]|nr:50S ribosomal protein L6 [Bryobacterales bacterium]